MKSIKIISFILALVLMTLSFVSCENVNIREMLITKLVHLKPWINEINPEDIEELRIAYPGYGMAPGSLNGIYYFTDTEVIREVLEKLQRIKVEAATEREAAVFGGGGTNFEFKDKNGTVYKLNTGNGFYYTNNGIYKLSSLPHISKEKASQHTIFFTTYDETLEIYTNTDQYVGIVENLGDFEFSVYSGDIEALGDYTHYITWEPVTIYIYSDTVFSYPKNGYGEPVFYELQRGMSFKSILGKN